MFPPLVRGLILPAHEALLGRDTFAVWRRLRAEAVSRTPLAQIQQDSLRALLDHATRNIPYWRDRLAGRLSPPRDGDPAAVLASVPVLTRSEIRRSREAIRWPDAPGKVLLHSSGGTTDDNLTFYWGRTRQSWDRAVRFRALERHGLLPGERALHLWPRYPAESWRSRLQAGLRDLRDRLTNDVVLDLRPFTPERLDAVLARCAAYRPALLLAYPSWLVALGEHIRAAHPRFRLPSLRLVLCMGEALFSFQRRLIADTFGVPVFQEYGSQDSGLIAHEDRQGVLRFNGEQMLVEVLRYGALARPGELGEVVVTNFHTDVMPFIRYATGDVVRQPGRPIGTAGESGLPPFPLPEGRTSDQLVAVDGELCTMRPVVEALVERAGLRQFALHQSAPDRIAVLEVEGRDGTKASRGEAEAVLRSLLGRSLSIEWRKGSAFAPLKSGKKRFVCSPVALRLLAHDQESGLSQARAWPQRLLEDVPGGTAVPDATR